jgi:hypothetical protein
MISPIFYLNKHIEAMVLTSQIYGIEITPIGHNLGLLFGNSERSGIKRI